MSARGILLIIIDVLWWAIIARIVISWLMVFGIRNVLVVQLDSALSYITEPIMRPLRRIIPPMGTVDLVPMAAILILFLVRLVVYSL